jgi:hypothetical protein
MQKQSQAQAQPMISECNIIQMELTGRVTILQKDRGNHYGKKS